MAKATSTNTNLPSSSSSKAPLWLWIALLGGLVQFIFLWLTKVPLGVPKEWVWERVDFTILDLVGLWAAILSGVLLFCYVFYLSKKIGSLSSRRRGLALVGLWIVGCGWILSLIASVPGIAGMSRAPFVLFYTRSSGYFTQARDEVTNVKEFLDTYYARIADESNPENHLHMGTHPPGLTLAFVAMIDICERAPAIRDLIRATAPAPFREGYSVVAQMHANKSPEHLQVDEAVLWLASVLVVLQIAGSVIPLYLISRRLASAEAAWWTAAFWLLVPAAAIFFPKSDAMFPCLTLWAMWSWLEAVERKNITWGAVTGLLLWIACNLTLAFLPIGLMITLQGIFRVRDPQSSSANKLPFRAFEPSQFIPFAGAAMGFIVPILLVWLASGMNLLAVWMQNIHNHSSFYAHSTRSYLPWLFVGPIELGFSLGLPLAVISLFGLKQIWRQQNPLRIDLLISVGVWVILWMSGKNMGEAARLWIFLMPLAVWSAALTIDAHLSSSKSTKWIAVLFFLQLIVCLFTVVRIDGFHFAELMK
ncbi:hypothetical protein SH668x_000457 [Planctomicrobium sp. SH668]|uniref:hypothetical protein n=1 Tax=Planctomicrobium sp. SH668 TaxID=3448126 RepID=UPI003F5AEDFC